MSGPRARPGRRLRGEFLPIGAVLLVFLVLAELVPRDAFVARPGPAEDPGDADRAPAGCAFVTLSPEREAAALAAARTSWQGESSASHLHIEMLPAELPACVQSPVLDLAARPFAAVAFHAGPHVRTAPPSVAAPPPVRLAADGAEPQAPAFSRESLLRLK